MGIGKQEAIRYFFGGNATLAVIVISMIILFLVYHSYSFFPQYREKLELYRKSGQEFTDFASEQLTAQKELSSLAIQAREYEIQFRLGALYNVRPIHAEFKRETLKLISSERKEYEREKTRLNDLKDDEAKPELIAAAQDVYEQAKQKLEAATVAALETLDYSTLANKSWKTDPQYIEPIRASVVESIMTGTFSTDFVANIKAQEDKLIEEIDATPAMQELAEARKSFLAPQRTFDKFVSSLRKVASTNKSQAVTYTSAFARKEALEKKASFAQSDAAREQAEIEAARVLMVEPD